MAKKDVCLALGVLAVAVIFTVTGQQDILRPAFSAGLTQMTNVTDKVNVTFDRVFLNVGNSYDATTGIFTAPYDGTYLFAYHALAEVDGVMYLDLYKNGDYMSSAYAHVTADYGSASNSMVLTLKRGDQVYVTGHGTSTLYGDAWEVYCTFSGYLMFFTDSADAAQ